MSNTVNLLNQALFYQNPIDALQTYNGSTQVNGVPFQTLGYRGYNLNLSSNTPASQYQRQKLIQNTVRVYASLYTMNLAGLSAYQKPLNKYQTVEQAGTLYLTPPNVNWNQMSDRAQPSVQVVKTGSGSTYGASSTKHTIVRNRPGAMSPGGVGVDIKHNSYDRYLNRLKGKSTLRRGIIPPAYGAPIPFNRAAPIYGGKTVKTSIVNGCDCPDINNTGIQDALIYGSELNAIQDKILSVTYKFNVGDFVWAKKVNNTTELFKGKIISILDNIYIVEFVDDGTIINTSVENLLIYFICNCDTPNQISVLDSLVYNTVNPNALNTGVSLCSLINIAASGELL